MHLNRAGEPKSLVQDIMGKHNFQRNDWPDEYLSDLFNIKLCRAIWLTLVSSPQKFLYKDMKCCLLIRAL